MALNVALEIVTRDDGDAAFVDIAIGDVAARDQVTQPLGRIGVKFIVIHATFHFTIPTKSLKLSITYAL